MTLCIILSKGYNVAAVTRRATPSLGDAADEAQKPQQLAETSIAAHPVHAAQKLPAQGSGHETASKVCEPLTRAASSSRGSAYDAQGFDFSFYLSHLPRMSHLMRYLLH